MFPTTIGQKYVHLALSIEQHVPGYIDSYFGPLEWKAQIQGGGPQPLHLLVSEAEELQGEVDGDIGMDVQRKDFLSRQIRAMHTTLRILLGEKYSLVEQAQGFFDITPTWTDEAIFKEAHQTLANLLPPGGTLLERMAGRKKLIEISPSQAEELLPVVLERLRRLTRKRFPIPEQETFEIKFVSGQPWGAYNWFLGQGHSRIEINTDFPLYIVGLAYLFAHEGYPGHHTELSNKEKTLFHETGFTEQCLSLINTPTCVVGEGLATCGLEVLMSEEEHADWLFHELLPRAGFRHLDVPRELAINQAQNQLAGVFPNAAFLLNDRGASADEVCNYIQAYGLETELEARKSVEFLAFPLYRAYAFTYYFGNKMIRELFEKKGNQELWFSRLLTEPVTPHQIRGWIET